MPARLMEGVTRAQDKDTLVSAGRCSNILISIEFSDVLAFGNLNIIFIFSLKQTKKLVFTGNSVMLVSFSSHIF